ncbi:hypothetical protein CLD22_25495 [Rubrivivax gelatinosus]|nr:hypothetical protein [Rubrivivax gelatinosus]
MQLTKLGVGGCALSVMALIPGSGPLLPAAAISVLGAILFPTWYLMARARLLVAAGTLLAGRVAALGAIALWVREPQDIGLGSVLNCAAPLVAVALASMDPELRGVRQPCRLQANELGRAFRLGASTVWINAVPALGNAMVQALIGALGSHATLGQYAAADKVRAAIQGLFGALGQALFPASVAAADGARPRNRLPVVLLALACAAALPLALAPEFIIGVVAGSGFSEAAGALRVMSLAVISSTAVLGLGTLHLLAHSLDAAYARAVFAGLLVQAAALAALVPAFGAAGAAGALWIADLAALAAMVPALRRR